MRADKQRATDLRKQGKSYVEICSTLGVAKSTLSSWFKGVPFSEEIRKSLVKASITQGTTRIIALNKARGDTLRALYERAEVEAQLEAISLSKDPLFIASICAYWGEGDKATKNQIRITNTDPQMLQIFVAFLTKICGIPKDKLRLALFLYPDLDEDVCKEFWSKNVGISTFHKTMILPSRHKTRRLLYGTCTVVYTNTYLKRKLLVWIDQMPKIVLNRVHTKRV